MTKYTNKETYHPFAPTSSHVFSLKPDVHRKRQFSGIRRNIISGRKQILKRSMDDLLQIAKTWTITCTFTLFRLKPILDDAYRRSLLHSDWFKLKMIIVFSLVKNPFPAYPHFFVKHGLFKLNLWIKARTCLIFQTFSEITDSPLKSQSIKRILTLLLFIISTINVLEISFSTTTKSILTLMFRVLFNLLALVRTHDFCNHLLAMLSHATLHCIPDKGLRSIFKTGHKYKLLSRIDFTKWRSIIEEALQPYCNDGVRRKASECMPFTNGKNEVLPLLTFGYNILLIIHIYTNSHIVFIRPSSDGTYYGIVISVRPSGCPSVRLSVCPSGSPSASFPHCSPTCFDILSWNFANDFVLLYCRSSSSVINLRQLLWDLCPFWNLEYWKYTVFRTFLLHALTYWAEMLHMTLLYYTTDQVWVSSICIDFCWSNAPFVTYNTGNSQFSALVSYMRWRIELKFCIWLCIVLQIKFECCQFASIFVGVMPLLELRILAIHSFPHFSLTCFDILSWNFAYDFVLLYFISSSSVVNLRQCCGSYATFGTHNTENTQFSAHFS